MPQPPKLARVFIPLLPACPATRTCAGTLPGRRHSATSGGANILYREWNLLPQREDAAAALVAQGGTGHLLGRVLAARGYDTPDTAAQLLGRDNPLPSPRLMQDMDRAVERIHQAIQQEEAIVVFGDYDVDGITATSLLYTYLESQGAQVFYKLPSRSDDDYGLSPDLVDQIADRGISLIITVDNGTTAFEAAQRAQERGVSLVVTDHHLPYDTLPPVDALINPCRGDDDSGLAMLSGVGVAFMLLAGLEDCSPEELLPVFGDLVAIGTIADVMKLTGPNRTIVRAGLAALQETQRPGLRALIDVCGWGEKDVTVENVSYGIAPRLNAAGRMDDATMALQLLLVEDDEEAAALVEALQQQNAARQKAEQEILDVIGTQMDGDTDLQHSRVLVIWGEGWHQGVIGIVASRLVDRYAKPAIVISFDGEEGRGSGRSIAGLSLHGAISSCEDILLRYGGHDLAAGFSIRREQVEAFRSRVNQWAVENNPLPSLPGLVADTAARIDEMSVEEIRQLERLAPCGSGNPAPRLMVQDAVIEAVYSVSEGRHSRLRLKQGGVALYAVLFGAGPDQLAYGAGDRVDVLLVASIYEGRQGPQVSARIVELRPAGMGNEHVAQSALFTSFLAGASPDGPQKGLLTPSHSDTAAVYRQVRSDTAINFSDLRPAFSRLGEGMSGRVMTALAALEELKLIERDTATSRYRLVPVEGKKDLAASHLMQRLGQAE